MMPMTFYLQPQKITAALLEYLEKRGRIKQLRPPQSITEAPHADAVEDLYVSAPGSGAHKLICVRKNQTAIRLTTHSENEEVIFLKDPHVLFRPLYVIISVLSENELLQKYTAGRLADDDIIALEVVYNDPQTLFFTIVKDTPHCEITVAGDDPAPIFYVTEPADIAMQYVDLKGLTFTLINP